MAIRAKGGVQQRLDRRRVGVMQGFDLDQRAILR